MPRFHLASIDFAKDKAKLLKRVCATEGIELTLSRAQDVMSKLYGYRDWTELATVTRAKANLPTPPGEIAFLDNLEKLLPSASRATSAKILNGLSPDSIQVGVATPSEDVDLLNIANHVWKRIVTHVKHGKLRLVLAGNADAAPEGYALLHLKDAIDAGSNYGIGQEYHEYCQRMMKRDLVREVLSFIGSSKRGRLADGVLTIMANGQDERFKITQQDRAVLFDHFIPEGSVGSLMNLRLQNEVLVRQGIDEAGVVLLLGSTHPTFEIIRERLTTGFKTWMDKDPFADPVDWDEYVAEKLIFQEVMPGETMPELGNLPYDGFALIAMPGMGMRDAVARLPDTTIKSGVKVITVGDRRDAHGILPCKIVDCSSYLKAREPFELPRRLIEPEDMKALDIVGPRGREMLLEVARTRLSVFVWSSDAPDILNAMARHRIEAAPKIAAETSSVLTYVGKCGLSRPRIPEWVAAWRHSEVMVNMGSAADEGRADQLAALTSEMTPRDLDRLRDRAIAILVTERVGKPCPHCADVFHRSWVFGAQAEVIRSIFTEDELRSDKDGHRILFSNPFGCEECVETGYDGHTRLVDIWAPSKLAIGDICDRQVAMASGNSTSELAPERSGGPGIHHDALRGMRSGLVDPLDWIRETDGEFVKWKKALDQQLEPA